MIFNPARRGVQDVEGLVLGSDVDAVPDGERFAGRGVSRLVQRSDPSFRLSAIRRPSTIETTSRSPSRAGGNSIGPSVFRHTTSPSSARMAMRSPAAAAGPSLHARAAGRSSVARNHAARPPCRLSRTAHGASPHRRHRPARSSAASGFAAVSGTVQRTAPSVRPCAVMTPS